MKNLSVMLKPASSACNMRCRYCFYADVSQSRERYSFGVMSSGIASAILDHIFASLSRGDRLCLSFQGGEPTLAGLDFFRAFIAGAEQRNAQTGAMLTYALQTNGLLIDDAWCEFLKQHRFLVGLSMDATAEMHDGNRMDGAGRGTFQRVRKTKKLMEQYQIDYNVLTVLTAQMARHPKQVWDFAVKENIEYLQLIPCLGELNQSESSPWALTPNRFAAFYAQLFKYWKEAYERGNYRSVKLFDDLVSLLAFGMRNACGITGECSPQIVVEADGGVYPCDFYVTDENRAGNLAEQTLEEIYQSPVFAAFCHRTHAEPKACAACPYHAVCGGGCKRMQREVCCGPEDGFCGYRAFLDACLPDLQKIAADVRRNRI